MTEDNVDGTARSKIIFIGLDDAGKTSIMEALSRNFNKMVSTRPTKKIQRRAFEFMGMLFGEWDLGGQSRYRDNYLQQPEKIFMANDIVIFVLDIQNEARIQEGIEYLHEIIKRFKGLSIEPLVYVFSHKYDPVDVIGTQTEINNRSVEIRSNIREQIDYSNFDFYRTSIFDLRSIYNAMSKILLSKFPKSKLITDLTEEFAQNLNVAGLEIIDDNSLIIGSFYASPHVEQLLNSLSPYFLEINDIFERVGADKSLPYEDDESSEQMSIQRFGLYFFFKRFTLRRGGQRFYVLSCKKDSQFKREDFDTFTNIMRETLRIK